MGVVLCAGVVALITGLATGGSLRGLPAVSLRGAPLLLAALAVQLVGGLLLAASGRAYAVALLASAALAGGFVLRNARVPGVVLLGAGLLLNGLVVVANGAMPVSVAAAAHAGVPVSRLALEADPRHEPIDDETRLAFLADVVPVPSPLRREVVSAGDLAAAAGVGWYAFAATRSLRPGRRRPTLTPTDTDDRTEARSRRAGCESVEP